ncbi:motility protein A [Cellulosilyticum sp. I15G10I2]|uniref:motility protein A n=1 Tax=Cellulosilyticum sp. I15G10I2 TaxID=1892843 RepID=UPI00085C6386|nr:MotA/TolQ/ExbB proton channel family protein [Cellulosilyticum sp. I15G10I2]
MDIATLAGLVAGTIFLILSIILSGGRLALFVDAPSMMIVFGGTLAALLISYPVSKFLQSFKTVRHAFYHKELDPTAVISKINELALAARKEGLLALEEIAQGMDDAFLQKGILLIVDGTDSELLRSILETEIAFVENRHKDNQGFWSGVADLGPAWGMIGTLIGLIAMLDSLDDPSTIGPKMSVALITTLYGSLLANFFATPVASKLKIKSNEEILHKQVMIEGLLSIQAGENPRVIEEKLKAFLSPATRNIFDKAQNTEEE